MQTPTLGATTLSTNLGQAAGVTRARRLQWQLALGTVCVVSLSIAIGVLAMTSC